MNNFYTSVPDLTEVYKPGLSFKADNLGFTKREPRFNAGQMYVRQIRQLTAADRPLRLSELVDRVDSPIRDRSELRGRILSTLEWMEETGWICWLPDGPDGDVRFCNYNFFNQIKNI